MTCSRCDLEFGELSLHRCRHGRGCLSFRIPDHCGECKAFKDRQEPLFEEIPDIEAKPFLKWAGGKRRQAAQIMKHMPEFSGCYFEPFVGGAALFFALRPPIAVLSDVNVRLVRTYGGVRYDVEAVIHRLRRYPFDKDFFLTLRGADVEAMDDDSEVAAWLIFLNKTAFNGLYRVNKSGGFNVPWGKYKNPTICDEAGLRSASLMLRRAELMCCDFELATRNASAGDLVYFDPPYVPTSPTADFTSYTKGKFGLNEQVRLRDVALGLKSRGVHVMITNSNTKTVRELYADGFTIRRLQAHGSVAASAKSRGKRIDLLMT